MTIDSEQVPAEKPLGDVEAFKDAAECLKTLAHPVRLPSSNRRAPS